MFDIISYVSLSLHATWFTMPWTMYENHPQLFCRCSLVVGIKIHLQNRQSESCFRWYKLLHCNTAVQPLSLSLSFHQTHRSLPANATLLSLLRTPFWVPPGRKGCPDQHSETAGREGGSAARLEIFLLTHLQDGISGLARSQFHASMQHHGMGCDNLPVVLRLGWVSAVAAYDVILLSNN